MLREFRDIYDIHAWLRYTTWIGLIFMAFFLLWSSGGFPPHAWLVLSQVTMELPRLWSLHGPAVVFSLGLLLCWLLLTSLLWLFAWILLCWMIFGLLRHHATERIRERWQTLDGRFLLELELEQRSPEWYSSKEMGETEITRPQITRKSDEVVTLPGLRLPQREQLVQREQRLQNSMPTLREPHESTRSKPLILPGYVAVQDIPTTPEVKQVRHTPAPEAIGLLERPRPKQYFDVGVGWNAGLIRRDSPNEDSLVVLQGTCTYNARLVPFGLFVVADGMGGHAFGKEASRLAIQSMMQVVSQNIVKSDEINEDFLVETLLEGVEQANRAICLYSRQHGRDMGTTLTAALVVDTNAYIINVGDSRTYAYREDEGLTQITQDHSLVARLVENGTITADEVYTHPERNKVYRSVGNPDGVEVDWFTTSLASGDSLLLCSDGLWEMVRDPDIERTLRRYDDSNTISSELVKTALANGGADNVSVIVVRMG